MNDNSEWVDRRMALLDPAADFALSATRAFARLHERDRRFRILRRNWSWGTAVAALAILAVLASPSRGVCCTRPAPVEAPAPPAVEQAAPAAPVVASALKAPARVKPATSYKYSGSQTAPLQLEVYLDYECPACGAFYRDTLPLLISQYVNTGKLRLLHRDFPLPRHPFAKLAAHYADAAGEVGTYDLVFNRLFETQAAWAANGDIDASLSPAVAPETMEKIRALVKANDPRLDKSIATDVKMGSAEGLNQTPTIIVIVSATGERKKLDGAPPLGVLKAYLDELLARP